MKLLSEEKIQKLLKDKKISLESFKESSSVPVKKDEPTFEDKKLEMISKQTIAIEKLSVLLHQNLVAILQKTSGDENLGTALKEHLKSLQKMLVESRGGERPKRRISKLEVIRDSHGKLDYVKPQYEDDE